MSASEAAATLVAIPSANAIAPPSEADVDGPLGKRETRASLVTLQLWWLDRMLTTPAPLQEKMTLYFHGHFTSRATPRFPRITYNQNALFRRNATRQSARSYGAGLDDAAMLIYLDGANNVASHPNENYARELMEIFTLGVDNYSEDDVRESARAWTGWRVVEHRHGRFDPRLHDGGRKTFLGSARATSAVTRSSASSSLSRNARDSLRQACSTGSSTTTRSRSSSTPSLRC